MGRLISMEDAIRAIEEEWDGCYSEYPATQIIYDTTEAIERLPIIQPEITHEQAVAYLQSTGWMQEHDRQMMLDGVRRLTAQPEPHWIPVTEEPIPDGEYLVTWTSEIQEKPILSIICRYGGVWDCWELQMLGHQDINVLAYMPLPEPYKGVTE